MSTFPLMPAPRIISLVMRADLTRIHINAAAISHFMGVPQEAGIVTIVTTRQGSFQVMETVDQVREMIDGTPAPVVVVNRKSRRVQKASRSKKRR